MSLTDEKMEQISKKMVEYVRNGVAIYYAAPAAGFDRATHYKWMIEGYKDTQKHSDTIKARYYTQINQVKVDMQQEAINNIKSAGLDPTKWQANAWLLERLAPYGYAVGGEEQIKMMEDLQLIKQHLGLAEDSKQDAQQSITEEVENHGREKEMDSKSDKAPRRATKKAGSKRRGKDSRKQAKKSRKIQKSEDT